MTNLDELILETISFFYYATPNKILMDMDFKKVEALKKITYQDLLKSLNDMEKKGILVSRIEDGKKTYKRKLPHGEK